MSCSVMRQVNEKALDHHYPIQEQNYALLSTLTADNQYGSSQSQKLPPSLIDKYFQQHTQILSMPLHSIKGAKLTSNEAIRM